LTDKRKPPKQKSKRLSRIENKKRRQWRQDMHRKRTRQIKKDSTLKHYDDATIYRLEAVKFAPRTRLIRYALDIHRPLTRDERSRDYNARYIDRLTGCFISKEDAAITMREMRQERQVVEIMQRKGISYTDAKEHWQHLLDTKGMGYIIRIYGS